VESKQAARIIPELITYYVLEIFTMELPLYVNALLVIKFAALSIVTITD
jgi:hypothetical protein